MTPEELLAKLNLKPKSKPKKEIDLFEINTNSNTEVESNTSPYALELDLFDQSMGDKLQRHNFRIKETGVNAEALSDFHAMCFLSEPTLSKSECEDKRQKEFVKNLFETPAYHSLHKSTEHDPVASELATLQFAQTFSQLKKEDEKRKEECKKKGLNPNSKKEESKNEAACFKAVGKALKEAEKEVAEYKEMRHALGMGPGSKDATKLDAATVGSFFDRIKNSTILRKIFEKAGPARRIAQSKRMKKVQHGYDDLVGVKLDGEVNNLLPHELGYLSLAETEDDALRRLVERQMLCREYRGEEPSGKGPFVICVDESGSMSVPRDNPHIVHAKALALAAAYNAKHEKRFCVLIGYSDVGQGTKLVLHPDKWDASKLLDWLEHNFSGGTDMDVPLRELPKWWEDFIKQGMSRGKTDMIIVSDAICKVDSVLEKEFLEWKAKEKVNCISLVMAESAGGLAKVSDEVHLVRNFSIDQSAIQNVLSI